MLCECGCGLPAPIATMTRRARGQVKGQPVRFVRGHATRTSFAEKFARYVFCHGDIDACWPWTGAVNSHGYGQTRIDSNSIQVGAHVATYRFFKGDTPAGLVVRHTCDQRACCNPAHLILGTHDDNTADMVARERQARGERTNTAILTDDIVRAIRAGYTGAHGEQTQLARQHGVALSTINAILRGRNWRHNA